MKPFITTKNHERILRNFMEERDSIISNILLASNKTDMPCDANGIQFPTDQKYYKCLLLNSIEECYLTWSSIDNGWSVIERETNWNYYPEEVELILSEE